MNAALPPIRGAGFLSLLSVPRVAASFRRPPDSATVAKLRGEGLEIAEIRLDLAESETAETPPDIAKIEKAGREIVSAVSALPSALTIRPLWEGGNFSGGEEMRRDLFLRFLPQVSAADIELAAEIRPQIIAAAKECGAAVIVSRHKIDGVDSPEVLDAAAERAFAEGADVFKYAGVVGNENDFVALRTFLQKWKTRPVIVVGMGLSEFARRSRRSFPAQGSRIAFAAVDGLPSAPGQLNLSETVAAVRSRDFGVSE
ncbi:MAG: type I 3-dehydroquinate dehydratase [Gammaproteobacteria bacterium]